MSIKQKKCKVCGTLFTPTKPMQKVCCLACALSIASLAKAKRERTALAADKRATREKLDAMKTLDEPRKQRRQPGNGNGGVF